jgi:hypothetical protein
LKILQRLDWGSLLLILVVSSIIDPGLERATSGVEAGLVGGDPLLTILLAVVWDFAEDANLFVAV